RDGLVKLPRLAVLYELPTTLTEDGGWKEERYWSAVNPNLGRSVDIQFLRNEIVTAEMAGAEQVALLASQHFNVEIGMNLRANRWPGADFWPHRTDPAITYEALLDQCEVIVPGIDGGGLDDLFGPALIGRHRETRDWLSWSHAWAHKGVLERRKSIATKLREFEKSGDLTIVDDELEDISAIIEIISEIKQRGKLGP